MWFEPLIRKETGCATYMVGSVETGECAVFDPLWDPTPYLQMAASKSSTIRYVIDSHSHADHVSGARRVAAASGGELIMHELAELNFEARRVSDRDRLRLGEIVLEIVHVPGHRPEQFNLLITDTSRGDEPWCLLTADFLMVGDIARPDLAQGGVAGAEVLFDTAIPRLRELPDFVEIYPGHVAGST